MKQRKIDINSNDNTLFVTEQCNNHCIMCCQPPKRVDDIDGLYAQNIKRIRTAPKDLPIIAITGGEPTLLGDRLINMIKAIREELPETNIHILTNGRMFRDGSFAKDVVSAGDNKIVFGIPLHSDYEGDHDKISGVKDSFVETMIGLYNLAMNDACIELRIVMNRLNYKRFRPMAEFIYKNLNFVSWVAYMGMECTGLAEKHTDKVWIEPEEYESQLCDAVHFLDLMGLIVEIYNIPLCLLPPPIRHFARQSISDWKICFPPICNNCALKSKCCGLFATSSRTYKGLNNIQNYGYV